MVVTDSGKQGTHWKLANIIALQGMMKNDENQCLEKSNIQTSFCFLLLEVSFCSILIAP